jgi:catalase
VQQSTKAQYNALTPKEKAKLAEEFRAHPEKVIRVNARSRTLDVLNVVNNMQSLVSYYW